MTKWVSTSGPIYLRILLALAFLHVMAPSVSWCAPKTAVEDDSSDDSEDATAPTSPNDDLSKKLEVLHNTEVVYASSKSEQQTTESPGSTTILTSSEIKVGGFRTLDDLLNYVRGFFVTSDRNYTYVGLRGFGSMGGYNSRILLLVDGHKINDNIYGQFYSGHDSPVDMDMVDHVEIIRGPASVLYGNSAVFGIINVITKKGKDVNGLVLSAQGGSLDTIGGGALYGGITDSGLQWTLEGSAYDSGGNANLYYPEYDNPSTNHGIAHNCDGENSQHGFLSLNLADWVLEAGIMNRYKTIPTGVYETAFNNPNNYTNDTDFFSEINFRSGDPESGQWLGRLHLDVADYTGNYVSASTGIPNIDIGDGAWLGAELQYVFTPFYRNKFTLGGEFIDNFEQFQKNYDLGGATYLDDSRQSTQWSLYAQDEVKLLSNIFLNAGGRYEYFSTTGGQFVPRSALVWEPCRTTVLKLVAGEAFRAPDAFELYYSDNGNSQAANPALQNENFETYEFDWEETLLTNHRVLLSLYHYIGENLILMVPVTVGSSVDINENIGHVSLNGLEVEYQYQNTGGIQGRLSWAYQRAQDDLTGQVLPDSPQNLGKASLQVPLDAKHLTVAGECQFTAASYGFNDVWAQDYTIFNLKLYSPHFIWENMEANLDFYNLFDTRYYQPVANEFQQLTLQQDGLVIWARLGYKL